MAAFPTTPVPRTLFELSGATPRLAPLAQSVLVIIDAQNEYVHGSLPLAEVGTAIAETARLLAAARRLGAPVVHVVHHSASGRPLFAPGTHGAEIVAELTPASAEPVVIKRFPNAFAGTGLADMLARLAPAGRTSLVLAGFMTHNCVAATARAALDLGYPIAAATATRDLPDPCGGAPIPAHVVQSATLAALADRTAAVVADTEVLLGIAARSMNWNIFADAIVIMVSAIVPVMNPIGCALILPQLTRGASKRERMALARSIGCYTLATLLAAMWLGPALIHLLGLSAAALRVAGGALVFAQAWRLLDDAAGGKAGQSAGLASAAFVPLTVPFTIGPGTMDTPSRSPICLAVHVPSLVAWRSATPIAATVASGSGLEEGLLRFCARSPTLRLRLAKGTRTVAAAVGAAMCPAC